jgi:hypothetical protein
VVICDIILDAVLTDEGRRRLALGDGSFRITKFALGDDEIDYSLYVPLTASGYEDVRIFQLPIFEAFTNNTTSLKNKLLTYENTNLLHLPVIKLNSKFSPTATDSTAPLGGYYVTVDQPTTFHIKTTLNYEAAAISGGYRFGQAGSSADESRLIFDQGLDTEDLSLGLLRGENASGTENELFESSYLVEVDNRLLNLTTTLGQQGLATPSFIDDDSVATYLFSLDPDRAYFAGQPSGVGGDATPSFGITNDGNGTRSENSQIGPTNSTGRLGSRLIFGLRSTLDLQNSQTLFDRLGGTVNINVNGTPTDFSFINTVIRVTGFTTGYRVEIPLKLIKYTS